jgi:hypothetical protein
MDDLIHDLAPDAVAQAVPGSEVDTTAQDLLQPVLEADEIEQTDGSLELGEQVHVAVGPGLSPRDGAEQIERANAEIADQRLPVRGYEPSHIGSVERSARHSAIVS